jgi:hypothetical protein
VENLTTHGSTVPIFTVTFDLGWLKVHHGRMKKIIVTFLAITALVPFSIASAHQSGCHRWHSCPSDTGSYVCGDLGYTSGCPRVSPKVKPAVPTKKVVTPVAKKVAPVESKQNCNPNYSGCLKIGSTDYDCKGGSGNGPYYTGKVRVIGYDQYGLDRDHDGWGCE